MREKKIKNNIPVAGPLSDLILKNIDEVVCYVTLDKKGKREIVFLSEKIKDILGLSKEKYLSLGKKIIEYCHPEDTPEIIKQTTLVIKKKIKNTFRYRFLNPTKKKYIWIEETIYPQLDKRKKLIGYFAVSRNIENEKKYEEQIIEDEKKFRLLAENSSDIIFHFQFKPNPSYTYVSPAVKHILGYAPENFYKDPFIGFKIIHPADKERLLNSQQNITGKKAIKKTIDKLVARYITKSGKTIWLENRYSPVYKGKEIIALHCVSRDITEQKQKEQERNESRMQLYNLLSNLPGIAYRCLNDKDWTMKFISSGSTALTGYKPDEFIDNNKRSFASIIHPEDRNIGRKEIKNALRDKRAFEIEYRIVHKSGVIKWIWEKGEGVYNRKNKLAFVEGFINDISARKAAETESNQKWTNYQTLVDSLPVGIFIHINGKILYGNKAAYKIVEIDPGADIGKISLLDFIVPEDKALAVERIKKVMQGKEVPFTDYRAIGAKGTHKDIRVKGMPIVFNSTHAVQIVIQDITLEKKLEEERVRVKITEQMNRDLQKEINLRIESEQKLKAIFESTTHLIWTLNRDRTIISYNTQYAEAVKNLCGTELAPGTKTTQFKWAFSEADNKSLFDAQTSAFKGKDKKIEVKLNAIDGKEYYREIHFHPIVINGKINEIAAVAQDTTERRNYEKQIIGQSARLKAIFESGKQLMWTVDKKIELTSFNQNYSDTIFELYGIYPQVNTTPGKFENKADSEEYHKFWDGKYEEVYKGKSVEFYTERTTVSGKKAHRYIFLHPIYNEKNEVIEVSCMGYDISEQKKAEKEILNKQSQLSAIINTTNDIIFSIDRNYKLVEFNNILKQIVKERSGQEVKQGVLLFELIPENYHAELKKTYDRAFSGENIVAIELFIVEGAERIYEAHYNPIKIAGKIIGIAVFSRDITDQKKNQEEILKSLKEKDVLLKEVHHRVKNNLQVISSILNLQTAYLKDIGTINILKECQNRIKTMAFIHESLYQNKDFSQINFSEYIVTLVKNLFYSFETNQQKIRAKFDVDEILLNLDSSIPCGLIVNELVSNALKYAFTDGSEGAIFVQLKKTGDKIKMVISDNGKGIPEHINYKNTETLGLQLVSTLTEQINGNISMERNKGTIFEIIF